MNNLEKAKNDMLIEGFRDIISNLYPRYFRETDEDAKVRVCFYLFWRKLDTFRNIVLF